MSDSLKVFTDAWGLLKTSPNWLVIALGVLFFGLLLKSVKPFPNRFIPLVTLPIGTAAYVLTADPSEITYTNPHPQLMLCFYGFILNFVVWMAHKYIFKRFEKYLPWLQPVLEQFDSDPPMPLPDGSNVKPPNPEIKV